MTQQPAAPNAISDLSTSARELWMEQRRGILSQVKVYDSILESGKLDPETLARMKLLRAGLIQQARAIEKQLGLKKGGAKKRQPDRRLA